MALCRGGMSIRRQRKFLPSYSLKKILPSTTNWGLPGVTSNKKGWKIGCGFMAYSIRYNVFSSPEGLLAEPEQDGPETGAHVGVDEEVDAGVDGEEEGGDGGGDERPDRDVVAVALCRNR